MLACLAALGLCLSAAVANADEAPGEPKESDAGPELNRQEWAFQPILAGNSDLGFLFGGVTTLAVFDQDRFPFDWRAQLASIMSVKVGPNGSELPFHYHYVSFDFPELFSSRARLYASVGFYKSTTAGYYGVGNASDDSKDGVARRNQYRLMGPFANLAIRAPIVGNLTFVISTGFRYNILDPYAGSRLEEDSLEPVSRGGDAVKVYGTSDHARIDFTTGMLFDTRNDETNPRSGSYNEISLRGSPGSISGAEHQYAGLNVQLRHFQSIYEDYLVLAGRVSMDMLFGNVPFYELELQGGLVPYSAFGGHRGVRGIPVGRYHGKIKIQGSLDLRTTFFRFKIYSAYFALAAVLFFDGGRVWADTVKRLELDGSGVGLKYGTGGGLRFMWGKTFMVSVDVAYSPDANPVGFYIDLGHSF